VGLGKSCALALGGEGDDPEQHFSAGRRQQTSAERRSWPLSRLMIKERTAMRLIISPSVAKMVFKYFIGQYSMQNNAS
jgi:hypothetical protein